MQLQKSLEEYQEIPKPVAVQHTGEGAGNFFGVRSIFAGILRNVPEKISIKSDLQKESSSCYFGRRRAPFLLKFSGVCSDFQGFCEGLYRFAQTSLGFFPNFHQIKTFGGALTPPAPCLPHEWCSIKSECYDKC